jgi:hypothetical protein
MQSENWRRHRNSSSLEHLLWPPSPLVAPHPGASRFLRQSYGGQQHREERNGNAHENERCEELLNQEGVQCQ